MHMSLQTFKETLKPCNNASSSSSSSFLSQSSLSFQTDLPAIPRKPPKSSLSQQLLRLQQDPTSSLPQKLTDSEKKVITKRIKNVGLVDTVEDEEGEDEEKRDGCGFGRPKLESFQFDYTGPFEPLILSTPGENPADQVPASINCRLLEHQRSGVMFLYDLYRKNHGGVLGDDMGLGKTIQTIAFLAAVYRKDGEVIDVTSSMENHHQVRKTDPVLIICPSSVIHNWEIEFSNWASSFSVSVYHGSNRDLILDTLRAGGVDVLITSFDTFRIHGTILSCIQWEIVIIDEAHRLKNEKSKLYQACLQVKTTKRYGLTGTMMQNKITELFNLMDWVVPGCLGTREHFREYYDEPLKHGQRSTAPETFVRKADERKRHLASVLHKYVLRRTKEETIGHLMLGKEDNVVFCAMSEVQKRVYRRMLQLPEIQCLINKDKPCSCGSPLTQGQCCRRIVPDGVIWRYLHKDSSDGCDSCPSCLVLPCLVKLQQISNHLELIKPNPRDDPDKQKKDEEFASIVFGSDMELMEGFAQNESFMGLSDAKNCGKMRVLENLMVSWMSKGDKVLLFSYSVRMLDILEKLLIRKGYCFSRLDGSTPTGSRQSLVDDFNSSPSKQVFLISTRAGGLGLNLVSANRVVIFDPNWNPAQDLQAQDRSFRFGQKRHVMVFRLLAAGSLEELVYSRQIYKQQLANIAVSGKMEKRYFEGVQDCKDFKGELFGVCNLFRDLSDKLFTSEIIDLHERHGQNEEEEDGCMVKQKSTTDKGSVFSSVETAKCSITKQPSLADLGIVYSHRNEEIVNSRAEAAVVQGKRESEIFLGKRKSHKREEEEEEEEEKRSRKRVQYGVIAEWMGMEVVEFSWWLISATPNQREQLLQDYYKKTKSKKKKKKRKQLPPDV
ncbi:switch 2 [Impatiens glandulifera]|uniref:switch 2 n=1 Tax=Impatiens glandulifera TaxID=253017 RepID=UPI001FB1427E|nr:switch 2 [Impatiens glandulifera]XP_047334781.1 switch 2 [Impatiens glandulifera]XP_047334782.1 switch 2 [Impatiens glandulifera]XP_047334783.1 switch 2 [Impatiens glandulifera]XP_047334784.1 switch 2 [Impatiens glandulifera]XP_047334785.1 switch 2 [Impatiens glandulifera]